MKLVTAVAQVLTIGVLMAIAGAVGAQQGYPNKPMRIIVPLAPGGSTTIYARLIGQKLTESWGQPVIVDNRAGGNTIIGTEALVKSPPDGYTIMVMAMGHTIVPHLLPTPYDPINDFAPIATIASSEFLLMLHPSVPANNLQEFIALAKSRPGQLNFASSGSGEPTRMAAELFSIRTGVKMQHVPYKGTGPAISDLIGGQVQLYFNPPLPVMAHIKSGRLKALAISGDTRLSALPQVAHLRRGRSVRVRRENVVRNPCASRDPEGNRQQTVDRNRQNFGHVRHQGKAGQPGGGPLYFNP